MSYLISLYLVAVHTSIAGMEIFSWLLFASVLFLKIKGRERFTFPAWPPICLLVLASAASLVFNPLLKGFWFQFGFMRWVLLFWGTYWAFERAWTPTFEARLEKLWLGLLGLGGAYATFQFFSGVDLFRAHGHIDSVGRVFRATGFFSMSLTFAYVFGTSAFTRLRAGRAGTWPAALLAMGLVASGARGAWIAAAISVGLLVLLARPRLIPVFVGAAAAACLALAALSPKFNDLLHLRLEHSSAVRVHLWRAYLAMFRDHPLFGVGLFQADRLLPDYYARLGIVEEFTSHAHNVVLQWAAGAGVLALGAYLWLSGHMLRLAWRIRRTSRWGWPLFMSQVYWHIGGLTEANFFDGEVNHAIVFTWALLLAQSKFAGGQGVLPKPGVTNGVR